MGNDIYETQDGIKVQRSSSSVSSSYGGTHYVEVSFSILVKDEDDEVAFKDANDLRSIITGVVLDIVADFAADGQEVEE